MNARLGRTAALTVALAIAGPAAGADNVRLVDRPADRDETRTLKLTPADRAATSTEQTHWRGCGWGWGGGWGGGWGWGRGWGGWGIGLGYYGGYRSSGVGYWGGYQPWGWGYGLGYSGWPGYYSGYSSWPLASYSLYAPSVYSYYSVPAVSYYISPAYYALPIVYRDPCPPATVVPERVETLKPANGNGTFRYDGGPARPIPPAREGDPAPADPKAPKLGPSPTDRPVSLPAPRKKYEYPAYGEGPDAPKRATKPARELLVGR